MLGLDPSSTDLLRRNSLSGTITEFLKEVAWISLITQRLHCRRVQQEPRSIGSLDVQVQVMEGY